MPALEKSYYVYELLDPRSGDLAEFGSATFYVGKGQSGRAFQHLADSLDGEATPQAIRIREMTQVGIVPLVRIVFESDNEEASKALRPLEGIIGRAIDIVVRTEAQIHEATAQNDIFIYNALAGLCVWRSDR